MKSQQKVNLFGRSSCVQIVGRPGDGNGDDWTWRVFTTSEAESDTPDGLTFRMDTEQANLVFRNRLEANLAYYSACWTKDFLLAEKGYEPSGEEIYSFLLQGLESVIMGAHPKKKLVVERPIRGGATQAQILVTDAWIAFETKMGRKETRRFDLRAFFLDPDLFRQKYPSAGYFNMHVPKSFRN